MDARGPACASNCLVLLVRSEWSVETAKKLPYQ